MVRFYTPAVILTLLLLVFGCSGNGTSPVTPGSDAIDVASLDLPAVNSAPGHDLAGLWRIDFDFENETAVIEPQRFPDGHMNVKELIPQPNLYNIDYVWETRTLHVDIKITNPYPVNGYDLRAIIFSDNEGHTLTNPDGLTPLFDIPQGNYINPFIAYAEDQPNRIFAGPVDYTEHFEIYFPRGMNYVIYAIDVSTPGNCDEPYEIQNFTQDVLFNTAGSTADVTVDVLDWQNNVDSVVLYAPNITGTPFTTLVKSTGNTWTGTLANGTGINPGTYKGLVSATSTGAGVPLYDYVDIVITAKQLWVYNIEGEEEIIESTCGEYSVEALGDTGITYDWTVDPPTAGYFEDPSAAITNFCANPLDANLGVILQVEVNSDHGGPITKTIDVTILNQGLGWPNAFGGTGEDVAYDSSVDSEGNVYVTGWFTGTVDFDPGDGEVLRTSVGGADGFLSKYDSSGKFIWVVPFGTSWNEKMFTIAHDNDDNIFVGGRSYTFSTWYTDVAPLYKFDSNGNLIFQYSWSNGQYNQVLIKDILFDGVDGIYISGQFDATLDLDPGPGNDPKGSSGSFDVWLVKLNDVGQYQWGQKWGGAGWDEPQRMGFDYSNNLCYITGYYNQNTAFLVKYSSDGNILLDNFFLTPSSGMSMGNDIALDPESNIYLTGYFTGTTDFDPSGGVITKSSTGGADVYVAKYNSEAQYVWVQKWGGTADDAGNTIFIGNNQNVYVSGIFRNTVDFDPSGPGADPRISAGGSDIFINVLDLAGNYDMTNFPAKTLPGAGDGYTNGCFYNAPFYYYLAGSFTGTMDFDPDPVNTANRTSLGSNDAYCTKMDLNGNLVKY